MERKEMFERVNEAAQRELAVILCEQLGRDTSFEERPAWTKFVTTLLYTSNIDHDEFVEAVSTTLRGCGIDSSTITDKELLSFFVAYAPVTTVVEKYRERKGQVGRKRA